jgi:hypothetical protein
MASNASELMRLMVIRSPEPKLDQPIVDLNPSDEIRRATPPFQKAREFLAKILADPDRRIIDPAEVPDEAAMAALRKWAFDSQSDGINPGALVEQVFERPSSEVIVGAGWDAMLRTLSDNILFYKLAYQTGPRPLTELANLYRAKVAVGRVAAGEITKMAQFRRRWTRRFGYRRRSRAPMPYPRPAGWKRVG